MSEQICDNCKYLGEEVKEYLVSGRTVEDRNIYCHRYPKKVEVTRAHWCGEWAPDESE